MHRVVWELYGKNLESCTACRGNLLAIMKFIGVSWRIALLVGIIFLFYGYVKWENFWRVALSVVGIVVATITLWGFFWRPRSLWC